MRSCIETKRAPAAIGPYSQAVVSGEWVFCAGQIPLPPTGGDIVQGGIGEQTRQVMENLAAILREAGTGLDQVVKTTIFLIDLADFTTVNEVYGLYFPHAPPARSTVQVAGLPKGARIEIEAIARIPSSCQLQEQDLLG